MDPARYAPDLQQAKQADIYYALTMFPYPSGSGLHCGHASIFTINDIIARWQRMQGKVVFNPFGFDAFGLPTENYAMKMGKPTYEVTDINKAHFVQQLQALDLSFDRTRMIDTSKPDYYKWTQWIFAELYKAGLVYRDELWVNRCPDCQTVLANDQVVEGKCERCKHEIIQKKMPQWFIKITDYADRLIADLDTIDRPQETKTAQKNWIGRSEGAEIDFHVADHDNLIISCFTTRPDTMYGVTAVVLAPENTILDAVLEKDATTVLDTYRRTTLAKTAVERQQAAKHKTGVPSGISVLHPLTGDAIPVRYADYVLADYGSGAVMMVPAHDQRDHDFAKKFAIPVISVIAPDIIGAGDIAPRSDVETLHRRVMDAIIENDKGEILLIKDTHWHFVGGGVESGDTMEETIYKEIKEESGYQNIEVKKQIIDHLHFLGYRATKNKNQQCDCAVFYVRLKDEERVPCEVGEGRHSMEWVKKEEVRNRLEREHHIIMRDLFCGKVYSGGGRLVNSDVCNGMHNEDAKSAIMDVLEKKQLGRRKITYKLRDRSVSRQRYRGSPIPVWYDEEGNHHLIPEDELPVELPLDVENYKPKGKSPLEDHPTFPVYEKDGKQYRRECDTLDTFMCSSFYFLRYPDAQNPDALINQELAHKLFPIACYSGGKEHTVGHLLYSRFIHKFLYDKGYVASPEPFAKLIHQGMVLGEDGRKMGKRRGNGVDPLEMIEKYGADALRTYLMFMGPVEQDKTWNDNALHGVKKFLDRIERLPTLERPQETTVALDSVMHTAIKGLTHDMKKLKFNTAVSKLMIFVNALYEAKTMHASYLEVLTLLIAPFATQLAERLWAGLGHTGDVHFAPRPVADETKIVQSVIQLPIQINGKMRGTLEIAPGASQDVVVAAATELEQISRRREEKEIKKIIYIPDKILNLIVA